MLNESHTSGLNFVALVPTDKQPQSSVLNCTKAQGYEISFCDVKVCVWYVLSVRRILGPVCHLDTMNYDGC
jgi:hypothetical protein